MRKTITICALLLSFVNFSCSKDKPAEDKAPEAFTVSVTNTTAKSAELNWTEAKDPEGQAVKYSIELTGTSLVKDLTVSKYSLTDLAKNTAYRGKVIAQDPAGNKTEAAFNFTTSDSPTPSEFTIQAGIATNKSVELSWTKSELPDNSPVTYDLYKDDQLVANVTELRTTLSSLKPVTKYRVKIVAKSQDGKSREQMIEVTTKENTAPADVTIQEVKHGINYVTFSGTPLSDPDGDKLKCFYVLNGVEYEMADIPAGIRFTYTKNSLPAGENHKIAFRVKDEFGSVATSNEISFKTFKQPTAPSISVWEDAADNIVIEWLSDSDEKFDPAASMYYVNNVARSMQPSQLSYTVLPNNTRMVRLTISRSQANGNANNSFKIVEDWGQNGFNLGSNSVNFMVYNYTPGSAKVSMATISGPAGSNQFFVRYENGLISDFDDWNTVILQFDYYRVQNFATMLGVTPNKGYHTGNIWGDHYENLKTKNTGFVIIQDQAGVHKYNFTYTVNP